jgi:hypothetical protein
MEWTIAHPDDPSSTSTYGFDPERGGVWAELEHCDVLVTYDSAEIDFDFERPVVGMLMFLATFGFIDGDAINDAFGWLSGGGEDRRWTCGTGRPSRQLRRVVRIVENLRAAAGGVKA